LEAISEESHSSIMIDVDGIKSFRLPRAPRPRIALAELAGSSLSIGILVDD
jgi:hypothetical protein